MNDGPRPLEWKGRMPPSVKKNVKNSVTSRDVRALTRAQARCCPPYCAGDSSDTDGSCSCPGTGKGKDPLASAVACRSCRTGLTRSPIAPKNVRSVFWPGSGARATDTYSSRPSGSASFPIKSKKTRIHAVLPLSLSDCCRTKKQTLETIHTSQVEVNCSAMTVMTFGSLMSPQRGVSRHGPRLAQRLSCGDKTCVSNPQPSRLCGPAAK
jgi:hypothetical protein